mgnify:CR=1 FL=1
MYVIELLLKQNPFPLTIERKNRHDAEKQYKDIRRLMENNKTSVLELVCEKVKDKRLSVHIQEVMAVQMYEKTASTSGVKRPGFSL